MLINEMLHDYKKHSATRKSLRIAEKGNGIYSKLTTGETEVVVQPRKSKQRKQSRLK